ncbi:phage minor head protein [Gordonia sp. (in: high G+C Gram-positive bacteria)]|uniref:phage minor head protein n=1 Tax=Gordonia sp. (in: high G+C Gram-positive bacteria) TaxID=84139 RepID=UPI0026303F47|nr:phage minor head protein [Gordonia sp. (in: high G+C Gram-positive bacteria)]
MTAWLQAAAYTVIRETVDQRGLTAAAPPSDRAVDAATAAYADWRRSVENNVLPAVAIQFGDAFQQTRLANRDRGSFTPQMEYMATVADRLRIWPEGAFEKIRPELIEALAEAETVEQITDRVGMVLGIDQDQRVIKAAINDVEAQLADPDLDPVRRAELRRRRRALWEQHDEEETRWRWLARRIARTEAHGAVQAGSYAAALQNEADSGESWHKRWLATDDPRTRVTHRVADGQTVPIREKFRVGGFLLDRPGDPLVIAPQEVINCRCTSLYLSADALQDALQGPDGSLGEVRPEGVRIGPDDPDEVRRVVDEVADREHREVPDTIDQRGEDHGQSAPADPVDVEITDEREAPQLGVAPDLSTYDDDQLLDLMTANLGSDDGLYEAAQAEYDRRTGFTAGAARRRR